jgi:hypothetical protein
MKKLIAFLKGIRLGQVLPIFLAGLLLLVSTACSNGGPLARGANQATGRTSDQIRPEVPRVDLNSKYQGGMNDYSDVDPKFQDTSGAEAKAKALRDRVERNITTKSVDSPEQYAENYRQGTPLGQRVKNLTDDISGSTKEAQKGVAKGTQRGSENLKQNTQNASEDLAASARDTAKNTQRTLKDASDAAS